MIGFFNRHKKTIFTITVFVFVISIFFGLGAYIGEINLKTTVAKIGSKKVPYEKYERLLRIAMDNMLRNKKDLDGEGLKVVENMIKNEVFKELIVEEIFKMQALSMGMKVSDFEVAVEIQNTKDFTNDGKFDPRLYVSTIWSRYRMTPKKYEEWRREIRLGNKFKSFIYEIVKVSPDDINLYLTAINQKERQNIKDPITTIKQQKFLDIANQYLKDKVSTTEIQDYRKRFEQQS